MHISEYLFLRTPLKGCFCEILGMGSYGFQPIYFHLKCFREKIDDEPRIPYEAVRNNCQVVSLV